MRPGDTAHIEQLVQVAKTGDPAARAELVNQACERFLILTRKMLRRFPRLRRWEETDDVYQNAMLRLHRALTDVTPDSARHFFNLAALQIRRELLNLTAHHFGPEGEAAHHDTDEEDIEGQSSGLQQAPSQSEEPHTLAEWSEFHELVEKLPDEEREVFGLLWYQGLSQEEAAVVLGVSVRTVKRRWQEVKIRLHDLLQGEPPM